MSGKNLRPLASAQGGEEVNEEAIVIRLKQIDAEFIGEQAKLLNPDEAEEWFEGELESWQAKKSLK